MQVYPQKHAEQWTLWLLSGVLDSYLPTLGLGKRGKHGVWATGTVSSHCQAGTPKAGFLAHRNICGHRVWDLQRRHGLRPYGLMYGKGLGIRDTGFGFGL